MRFVWQGQERGDGDDRPRCREAGGSPACVEEQQSGRQERQRAGLKIKIKPLHNKQRLLLFYISIFSSTMF